MKNRFGDTAKIWDDSAITPLGQKPAAPQTAGTLFADLGVNRADEHTRRTRVRDWLQHHEPSNRLTQSLTRRGYGDLL